MIKPYHNESLNKLYNGLFCDMPSLFTPEKAIQKEYPWNVLMNQSATTEEVISLTKDSALESRAKLLGYHKLKSAGHSIQDKELLGVVVEVGLDNGLDVLAAYSDGTARYINQVGKIIIWETRTPESDKLINDLFAASAVVVNRIGAWDKPRMPQPGLDEIRLNFLVSDGLYFGQGPVNALAQDAMGGPVIYAATQLLQFLTSRAMNANQQTN